MHPLQETEFLKSKDFDKSGGKQAIQKKQLALSKVNRVKVFQPNHHKYMKKRNSMNEDIYQLTDDLRPK